MPRVPMDLERYARAVRDGPCFTCAMVAGDPRHRHQVVYEDVAQYRALMAEHGVLEIRDQHGKLHAWRGRPEQQ